MKGRNWKEWFKKAGIRAAHTVAQSAVGCIGTAVVVESVDWKYVLSASLLAGALSILKSVIGLPEEEKNA